MTVGSQGWQSVPDGQSGSSTSQKGVQQPTASQPGTLALFKQVRPGPQSEMSLQAAPNAPPSRVPSPPQTKPPCRDGTRSQRCAAGQSSARGSHRLRQGTNTPISASGTTRVGSKQVGRVAGPVAKEMQVPSPVCAPMSQQNEPRSQSSDADASSAVQGSPGPSPSDGAGTQRLPAHTPPSSHGTHLSPAGQSCVRTLHRKSEPPPTSGIGTKPCRSTGSSRATPAVEPGARSHPTASAINPTGRLAIRCGISPRAPGVGLGAARPTKAGRSCPRCTPGRRDRSKGCSIRHRRNPARECGSRR